MSVEVDRQCPLDGERTYLLTVSLYILNSGVERSSIVQAVSMISEPYVICTSYCLDTAGEARMETNSDDPGWQAKDICSKRFGTRQTSWPMDPDTELGR